jgi:hypothetical protein
MKVLIIVGLIILMSIIGARLAENAIGKIQARQAEIAAVIGGAK